MPASKHLAAAARVRGKKRYDKCRSALRVMVEDGDEGQIGRFVNICLKSTGLGAYEDALPAGGETFEARAPRAGKKKRYREKKSDKGYRKNCVYSKTGKLVRCFERMKTAQDVARGFGSGFYAEARK